MGAAAIRCPVTGSVPPLALAAIVPVQVAANRYRSRVVISLRIVYVPFVAVDFLTGAQAAAYGRFDGGPSQADLERFFLLDDADKALIPDRRGLVLNAVVLVDHPLHRHHAQPPPRPGACR